ncbi:MULTISPECIES: VOC family protein [Corallincola]|uniref:VOC family protein n=2 Tax=Corallincola TaxID=1775176 RepID=A0A368NH57_9GAMM|nr:MULTISPECIES: VOC family protein [Corallincola]RCU49516.1 VOC family protein [Corallincola holothuriorum]TAA47811.1 VOC family protein [Corallincola spongiicola]
MIRLEHINLVVPDLKAALAFYQVAFPHWHIRGGGEAEWYGTPREWLHFGDENNYITLNDKGTGENRELTGLSTGLAHFAFVVDDIDGMIARLEAAGYPVAKQGADEPYRKNVYFIDPAGFEVEFVQYLSDIPDERNRYS